MAESIVTPAEPEFTHQSDDFYGYVDNAYRLYKITLETTAEGETIKYEGEVEHQIEKVYDQDGVVVFREETASVLVVNGMEIPLTMDLGFIGKKATANGYNYYNLTVYDPATEAESYDLSKMDDPDCLEYIAPLEIGENTPQGNVIDYENLTVPAGSGKAYRIVTTYSDEEKDVTQTVWVVPGIGFVKMIDLTQGATGEETVSLELISYTY